MYKNGQTTYLYMELLLIKQLAMDVVMQSCNFGYALLRNEGKPLRYNRNYTFTSCNEEDLV